MANAPDFSSNPYLTKGYYKPAPMDALASTWAQPQATPTPEAAQATGQQTSTPGPQGVGRTAPSQQQPGFGGGPRTFDVQTQPSFSKATTAFNPSQYRGLLGGGVTPRPAPPAPRAQGLAQSFKVPTKINVPTKTMPSGLG